MPKAKVPKVVLYYFEQEDIIYSKHIGDVPRKTYTYEPIPAESLKNSSEKIRGWNQP